ncbi:MULTISPECIES: NAD(P)-dependent oxidoreductase [Streptomyces]|uniref:SDR family oxidoreductase n=1 Tax=Streptomyces siderophoricus TaxID=2802281 RepID=A0ABS1MTH4_9ACTN|nr:SDR family oxidoreductase [Streptomyces sp. 9-7]MBL1091030.1 SDR family oxidoreductase [Streptomyces sp. 9-7]
MKLTVLGASGGVGRQLVTHALADGHQVTAALRSPEKLTERHERLTVVRTDPLDPASVKAVVDGADAVLSGMGQAGRHDPLRPASTSARAVVEAMTATGVRRLLVVSAGPLNRTGAGQPFLSHRVFGPLLWAALKEVYTDLTRMEAVLRDSGLDWTAVRPPRLLDRPGEGRYRHAVEAGPAGSVIARADVARAMLDFVTDPRTYGHAVGVSR